MIAQHYYPSFFIILIFYSTYFVVVSKGSSSIIQPAAEQPTIVWLCPNEQLFELARTTFVMTHTPLKAMIPDSIKYYVS